jgi:Cdc6-like AAA superfamily ATPase
MSIENEGYPQYKVEDLSDQEKVILRQIIKRKENHAVHIRESNHNLHW